MNVAGFEFNTDPDYVVLQRNDDDGGDAPARTGDLFFWIGVNSQKGSIKYAVEDFTAALSKLAVPGSPGDYYRYPDEPQYRDAADFSRDQRMQLVLAMGALGMTGYLLDSAKADARRFSRTSNGDLLGLQAWTMYARAMYASGLWYLAALYPLFFLGDLGQLINAALISFLKGRTPGKVRRWLADRGLYFLVQDYPSSTSPNDPTAWSQHGPRNVGDDVLLVLYMLASKRWLPTPVSWLARKLYARFRPTYDLPYIDFDPASHSYVNAGWCDRTNGATYAFDVYFMPSSNANPFNGLYHNLLVKEIR